MDTAWSEEAFRNIRTEKVSHLDSVHEEYSPDAQS